MAKSLREFAEIRNGNMLLIFCQGRGEDGGPHCGGMIRVPFTPSLPGCKQLEGERLYWSRIGDTLDDMTLHPSVDAGTCGHFNVTRGAIHG